MISLSDVLPMCILILTTVFAMIAIILTMEQVKKNMHIRRKEELEIRNNAEMDDYRRYFEEKIYALQKELLANERRWVDANHLVVSGQSDEAIVPDYLSNSIPSPTKFFKSLGISVDEIIISKKTVFVLTPFSSEGTQTFEIIRKICNDVDLKCSRGDEIRYNDNILSHIVKSILQANIVIANVDGRNPNVFYELGICHAIGKPIIIISNINVKGKLPFDINAKSIIFYKDTSDLQYQLRNELLKAFIGDMKSN